MKKKLSSLILCMVLAFALLLSGCDLFPKNYLAYLNKSVCTITYADGTKEEITTEDYINAFNSYGASLVQSGTEYAVAAEQTIEILINRFVLLNYAKKNIDITEDDKKEILDDVYSSLKSNMETYETEVRNEWDMATPESQDEEQDVVIYQEYVPTAEVVLVNGEYKIKLIDTNDDKQTTNFASLNAVVEQFKNYATFNDNTNNTKIRKEAYRRFLTALKKNEQNLNLSTDYDSILMRYAEKLYESTEENFYITNLEKYYKTEEGYSTITVSQVLNKYKTLLLQSKFKFEASSENYDKAMLESFEDVYYVVDDNYFFVSHILMKYDETSVNGEPSQKEQYDNLKTEYENGYITKLAYEQKLDALANQVQAKIRDDDGKLTGNTVSANQVLKDLTDALDNPEVKTNEDKANEFRDYMYKYSEDTGTMNAEYMYVVGTETSQMVESFTENARELNDEGVFGQISSKLIASEYGVHILFYGGKVENLFTVLNVSSFNLQESDIEQLTKTKLSALNNKTLFDKVFELLSEDNYSIFENMNLNVLKKDIDIKKHESVYMNL